MLSQFPGEAECLFPPCTMLAVKEEPKIAAAKRAGDEARVARLSSAMGGKHEVYGTFDVKDEVVDSKSFVAVNVLPTFL